MDPHNLLALLLLAIPCACCIRAALRYHDQGEPPRAA